MAAIRKNGARKNLEHGSTPFPIVKYDRETNGLVFAMQIGFHQVTVTHVERDMLIEKWAKLEKEFEQAKGN